MTKILTIIILFLGLIGNSQNCSTSSSLNLSTGLATNNSQLTVGSIDPFWKLAAIGPLEDGATQHSSVSMPNLYIISPHTGAWNNVGTGILSPKNTSSFPENNAANSPWKMRRFFCIQKKGRYTLSGNYRCDDKGSISIHNLSGTQLAIFNTLDPGYSSNTMVNSTLELAPGTYYLETRVMNTNGVALGFAFNGTLSGSELRNPQNNEACCPVGSISVLKIIDNNCNGKYDNGDALGQNWKFEIFKDGVMLGAITTDAFGIASLNGLTSGTYTVKELEKNGYYSYQSTYSQNASLLKNDSKQITFFNCVGSPPPPTSYSPCCPPMVKTDIYPMFTPVFQGGASGPYTMKITMPQSMKDGMQAYINLLKHTCKAKQLIINWQLCEVTASGGCTNLETKAVIFTAGSTIPTIPTFFTTTLQQDKQYRITVIYKYDGEKCFDKTCDDPLVKPFEWDIDKKMGTIINKSN